MICTNTDHYVNTLSSIKKEKIKKNIPGNFLKHFGKCCQTFREVLPNIPGNAPKHSLLLTNDAFSLLILKYESIHSFKTYSSK